MLSRCYNSNSLKLKSSEEIQLGKFLDVLIDNAKINKKIKEFNEKLSKSSKKVHEKAIEIFLALSYKIHHLEKFDAAYQKLLKIEKLLQRKESLSEDIKKEEKLNHKDLIELEEKAKLSKDLKELKKFGLIKPGSRLSTLNECVQKTSDFIQKIQKICEKDAPHKKSGSLIFYDIDNYKAKRTKFYQFLSEIVFRKMLKTSIFHASLGYRDLEKQDVEVDMWQKVRKNRRTLYSRTFKTLEFNVDKLAEDEKTRNKLILLYGKKWKEVIEEKFHEIILDYFKDMKKFENLSNSSIRKFLVGIGFRWAIFDRSIDEQMQFDTSSGCVCSEFALKTYLQCFTQLQKKVKEDWEKISKEEKEVEPILRHPIRRYRRLNRVRPDEIVTRLLETGYAKISPQAKIIDQIIDYYHYDF